MHRPDAVCGAQMNQNTKRMEYEGAVLQQVTSMADLPHGGQIIIDEATFDGIKSSLAVLRERVAKTPNMSAVAGACRSAAGCLCLQIPATVGQTCMRASVPAAA